MFVTDELRRRLRPLVDTLMGEAAFLERYVQRAPDGGETVRSPDGDVWRRAAERSLQIVIEAVADAGNALIDALVMRDPGSYADIVDILLDEHVIAADTAAAIQSIVALRRSLLQDYARPDEPRFLPGARRWSAVRAFAESVSRYAGLTGS